jgi:hypothetical protein
MPSFASGCAIVFGLYLYLTSPFEPLELLQKALEYRIQSNSSYRLDADSLPFPVSRYGISLLYLLQSFQYTLGQTSIH